LAKKKFSEEIQKIFDNVEVLLNGMINDRSVPRNIKRIAQQCIDELHKEGLTPGIIASNIMYMVDDLSQDPNCPFHTRTTLFRLLSLLENVKD